MITPISSTSVLPARNVLNRNQAGLSRTMTRLATGRRINSGKDDPAGLISSENLAAEIKSLQAETESLRRANSYANITAGHTSQLSSLMGELNGLVVASANQAGMTDAEIAANQMQIDSIVSNIERVRNDAVTSLDGFNMPDSGNADVKQLVNDAALAASSVRSGGVNSLASGNLEAAQTAVEGAIDDVAIARGRVGSYQKYTVETHIRSNEIAIENITDSKSRIVDADFAIETANLTRYSILTESNIQVLKVAQQQGKAVLDLLT